MTKIMNPQMIWSEGGLIQVEEDQEILPIAWDFQLVYCQWDGSRMMEIKPEIWECRECGSRRCLPGPL